MRWTFIRNMSTSRQRWVGNTSCWTKAGRDRTGDPDDDSIYKGYYDWTQELIDYANEKGVGLIVWANSADLDTPEEQEERITEWGADGLQGRQAGLL